jgi:hypothetical protein
VRGSLSFITALLFTAFIVLLAAVPVRAELPSEDLPVSPFALDASTEPLKVGPSPYVPALAKRLDWPVELIEKIEAKGFGRTEMVIFITFARKSAKSWDDLVKQRQKGNTLRGMAEAEGFVYNDLFRRSREIKLEVEASLPASLTADEKKNVDTTPLPEKTP